MALIKCSECLSSVSDMVDICPHCGYSFDESNSFEYSDDFGFIYVLSNPAMPGLLKIGYTSRDPNERAQELSSATGIPEPFTLECFYHSNKAQQLERIIHQELAKFRHNSRKEFFKASLTDVIPVLYKHCGDAAVHYIKGDKATSEINVNDGLRPLKNTEIWRNDYICGYCHATLRITHDFCLKCGNPKYH